MITAWTAAVREWRLAGSRIMLFRSKELQYVLNDSRFVIDNVQLSSKRRQFLVGKVETVGSEEMKEVLPLPHELGHCRPDIHRTKGTTASATGTLVGPPGFPFDSIRTNVSKGVAA